MNDLVRAHFQPNILVFSFMSEPSSYFRPAQSIAERDLSVSAQASGVDLAKGAEKNITVQGNANKSIRRQERQGGTFEERVFDALVLLKVAVSEYAMHLDSSERHKIFSGLDDIINVEDWHDGDKFPEVSSVRAFLKLAVYASFREWTSLGVSDDGNILLAWQTGRGLLTANFAATGDVRWTPR